MSNTMDDQMLTKASVPPRDDMVYKAMKIWMMDMKRIKYLNKNEQVDEMSELILTDNCEQTALVCWGP